MNKTTRNKCKLLGHCLLFLIIVLLKDTAAYNSHYMQELCQSDPNKTEHHVHLTRELHTYGTVRVVRSGGYDFDQNCKLYIWAPEHFHIIVRFNRVDTHRPDSGDKDCMDMGSMNDRLLLRGNSTTHYFCGTWTPSYALISTENMLLLQFISKPHDGYNEHIGFDLYYTAFHQSTCDTSSGREFQCRRDYRCIPGELTCDGRDNCGDWSDERTSVCGLPVGSIVMITLICVLVAGTCIAAAVYYFVESKTSTSRSRSRRNRSREVEPEGPYTIPFSGPRITEAQSPPPYSHAPPLYSAEEKKEAPPPAYQNLSFENDTPASASPESSPPNTGE